MARSIYENRYRALFTNMTDGFIYMKYEENDGDPDFIIKDANPAFCAMMGVECEIMRGCQISTIFEDITIKHTNLFLALQEVAHNKTTLRTEIHSDALEKWFSLKAYSAETGFVAMIIADITPRRQVEETLEMITWGDPLTNLFNRRYFDHVMRKYDEDIFSVATVFSIDLDGLKMVNDLLGHIAGDELLTSFAEILRKSFRKDDIVARVGGDEFAAIISNCDKNVIDGIMSRINELINEHNAAGEGHPLSISIGFAGKKDFSTNMISVYNEADEKMYKDKKTFAGKRRVKLVDMMIAKMRIRFGISNEIFLYFEQLMKKMAKISILSKHETERLLQLIRYFDIGKVAVRDDILLKKDILTNEERDELNRYIEAGYRLAAMTAELMPVTELILRQHENWDGSGYPSGLSAENIPIQCRIFRIVEAYIAMISQRPYREPMDKSRAMAELQKGAGTIFDSRLVEKFARIV